MQTRQSIVYGVVAVLFFVAPLPLIFAEDGSPKKESASQSFQKPERETIGSLTYYFDSREYNTLNLLTSTRNLPLGFDLWGFVDLHGDQKRPSKRFELTRYFIEYRLRRELDPNWVFGIKGIRLEAEYNGLNGTDNDVVRFGPTYRHTFHVVNGRTHWLQWRFHPLETDGSGMQASVIYFFSISPRLYITGFADYNINNNASNQWVVEPQLNIAINKTFDLVVEGRYNGFEDKNSRLDGLGVAGGLKIKF